ncbi:virion structural protein [Vibrio phage BONAISHI]|nr:virion structural protein [Vibrio phage BONAISHI]
MNFEYIHRWMNEDDFVFEAIDFQPDTKFGQALEDEINAIRNGRIGVKEIERSRIGDLIGQFTGMKAKVISTTGPHLSMDFGNMIQKNHPFVTWEREFVDNDGTLATIKKMGGVNIHVDMKRGYVHGLPDEIIHKYTIGAALLKNRALKTRQIVAGILHEVGHWLGAYVWMGRTLATNYLLTDFTLRVLEVNDEDKKYRIINEAKKKVGRSNDIFQHAADLNSFDQAQTIIIGSEIKESRRELGLDIYSVRGWEQIADQYASRWGYGKEVIDLLDNMYASEGMTPSFIRYERVASEIWAILFSASLLTTGVATGGILSILSGSLIFAGMICPTHQEEEYDDVKKRFQVIRKDMVGRLKETDDKEGQRIILKKLDAMQETVDKYSDELSLFKFMQKHFGFINGRRIHRNITTQKLLEELANSELNVLAARLEV